MAEEATLDTILDYNIDQPGNYHFITLSYWSTKESMGELGPGFVQVPSTNPNLFLEIKAISITSSNVHNFLHSFSNSLTKILLGLAEG